MTSLKLSFNGEIRRLSVTTAGLTYEALKQKTLSVFPHLSSPLQFSWVDDEDDKVVISSDEELSEALRVMANEKKGYLRFDVEANNNVSVEDSTTQTGNKSIPPAPNASGPRGNATFGIITHVGIVCDECGASPLTGARFKCAVRDDFDLCESCEAKSPQQPYPTVKIYRPDQVPAGIMVLVDEGRGTRHGGIFRCGDLPNHACHRGVTCNGCQVRNFHGPRFKCSVREDYDLCSACEERDGHEHVMVKIYPRHAGMRVQVITAGDQARLLREDPVPHLQGLLGGLFARGRRGHGGHHHHGPPHHHHHHGGPPHHHGTPRDHPHGHHHRGSPNPPHHRHGHPHRSPPPPHEKESYGGRRGRNCWDRSSVAQAAADRARLHTEAKLEQQRQHKAKEDARLEDEMLEMCIKQSLAEKERLQSTENTAAAVKTTIEPLLDTDNEGEEEEKSNDNAKKTSNLVKDFLKARFVKHITMPDGSEIAPRSSFVKTWRVRNDGQKDWPSGCILVAAGGDRMVDPRLGETYEIQQAVPCAPAGCEVDVTVELMAPNATGRHMCFFRLQTAEGVRFGQRLWADILVNEADLSVSMTLSPWEVIEQDNDELDGVKKLHPDDGLHNEENEIKETNEISSEDLNSNDLDRILDETPLVEEQQEEETLLTNSQQLEAQFDTEVLRWARELQVLSAMGFNDLEVVLPVLQEHILVPASEQQVGSLGAPRAEEGLQAVVLALLAHE